MSWRTVVIANRCKLDLKMGCMVVRGEETKRVFIDEIAMLIIENTAVSLTAALIAALTEKKVKIVFCDERRNPTAELVSYCGAHDSSRKIRTQINWDDGIKGAVWTEIVSEKIRNQADLLQRYGYWEEERLLRNYLDEIEFNDAGNREGHAAKVYFNALFGKSFSRGQENTTNAALNYGYGLLLSAVNREIVANGYLTQLGIFHDNMFNHFNLGSDLMEPFRVLADKTVIEKQWQKFTTKEKHEMIEILHETVLIGETAQTVLNAIKIYTRSVFDAINERDISYLRFAKL